MNILDWLEILKSLNEQEKQNLSLFCQEKIVIKWETIFKEWDSANAMYILKKWQFEIFENINWTQVSLWNVDAEEILWEMALFDDSKKRMATAIATKNSTLITILSFSLNKLIINNPRLLSKIKEIIEERDIDNKIVEATA